MANLRMCFLKESEVGDASNNITQYVTMLDGAHASVSGHVNMFSSQTSGARTLFASSLQVVLKRLLEHMMRSGESTREYRDKSDHLVFTLFQYYKMLCFLCVWNSASLVFWILG